MKKPHVYMCVGGEGEHTEVKVYFGTPPEEGMSLTSALWQMAWILRFTDWLTQEVDRVFSPPSNAQEGVSEATNLSR